MPFDVIDQDDAFNGQSERKLNLHRPTAFSAGDRTDHSQAGPLVVGGACQDDRRPPTSLFAAGMGREVHPDKVAAIRERH